MKREWILKRNCSLTPRQMGMAYALLCSGALGIALFFVLQGIWVVFGFALIELAGITCALLHYARHALDHEHIALTDGCLLIERVLAGRRQQVRLDPAWTRIALPEPKRRALIGLESRGVKVEVGSFVTEAIRQQVAEELRHELRDTSYLG
ncbi:DUF2244 domain-containing protein [Massilia horti]|uniref:DUF2244 domain-containing protein n=1 Tax=Massilia horti TaxID=2562153 RepID=A0A4Y9STT4_9BURK|nr:DUF2244 domain-containing protein [Massilia horti]TFW28887.1 DUF2244 domain-containing protein [Massilia horti]